MEIIKKSEGAKLTVTPAGRIDTVTSPEFEAAIVLEGVDELVIDLSKVDYISSAGLRVLLTSKKRMAGKSMLIMGACAAVKEVFDITGFSDIFTFA